MSTAEKLALMTAHGVSIGHIPGGIPNLTAEDVAGALGMAHLKRGPYLLMLAKYCGDQAVLPELNKIAREAASDIATRRRWKLVRGQPGPLFCDALAVIAVDEVVNANRCGRCRGTGEDANKKSCPRCSGSGSEPMAGGDTIAQRLSMPRSTWYSTWSGRFADILGEVRQWEAEALDRIGSALKR